MLIANISNPASVKEKLRTYFCAACDCGLVWHLLLVQHGDALRFERHHSSQDPGRSADVVEPQSSLIHLSLQPAFDQRSPARRQAVKGIRYLLEAIAFSDHQPVHCDNFGA
jgi:hypothetical protein